MTYRVIPSGLKIMIAPNHDKPLFFSAYCTTDKLGVTSGRREILNFGREKPYSLKNILKYLISPTLKESLKYQCNNYLGRFDVSCSVHTYIIYKSIAPKMQA